MTEHDANLMQRVAEAIATPAAAEIPEFIPHDAPFDEEQRLWLSGLFTGLFALTSAAKASQEEQPAGTALTILFGSQSGTSEALSKDLRKLAATQGFDATIAELDSFDPAGLANLHHLLIIAATFGEGEPTDNAANFYNALMSDDAAPLPETLNYSVCGMGDSSYTHFNKVGRDLDARLAELGANRAAPMAVCDVAYDDDYADWCTNVFAAETFVAAAGAAQAPVAEKPRPRFDKNTPFTGTILDVRCLSGQGSAKRVNHIEISLAGGGEELNYEAGDALGLWPINDQKEVNAILEVTGLSGAESVTLRSGCSTLRAALLQTLDLTTVTPNAHEAWHCAPPKDWQIIDVLREGIQGLTPQMLVDGMRPLQPRLYSISSSPKKHPGEVHLTVGEVHYDLQGTARQGVASTYLGARVQPGSAVGVYVQRSAHFHLPDDDTVPLIMIGPGTGIAPFRAFLEDRQMRGASGRNWLFFGDQHAASDYLYEEEISAWVDDGTLDRISLAWSRDGSEKVYVQHLIERDARTFFEWLEDGAIIYVCGDASRMANDVAEAILNVISAQGQKDRNSAVKYLKNLKENNRYQRDVY